jgi:hypothetical protein
MRKSWANPKKNLIVGVIIAGEESSIDLFKVSG